MTIALGFVHSGGVLLAADTEVSTYAWKDQQAKIGHFEYPGGRFAFGVAGNKNYALSTVEKIREALHKDDGRTVSIIAEDVLNAEYQRLVYSNPTHASDLGAPFWLLFAFRPYGGRYELYSTDANSVRRVDSFECIGIGEALARILLRPMSFRLHQEDSATNMAIYALAMAKKNVPGCGGPSMLINFRHNGQVGGFGASQEDVDRLEALFQSYNVRVMELLSRMINPSVPERAFEQCLERFSKEALQQRRELFAPAEEYDRRLAAANPNLDLQEVKQGLLYPIVDP